MKKIYFLIAFSTCLASAQTFNCGTEYDPSEEEFTTFNNDIIPDDDEIFVLDIFFHVVTDDNGNIDLTGGTNSTTPNTYGEEEMMEMIWALNRVYGRHNIFFKYRGFDVIADSDLTNNVDDNTNGYSVSGNINVYLVNYLSGANGVANQGGIRAFVTFASMETHMERTLVHELGHCMNLFHTNQTGTGGHNCEHVTRDPNDPDYNADVAGDKVADTAAEGGSFNWSNWDSNCQFVNPSNLMDCDNTGAFADVELNYLSSHYPPGCEDAFILTPGQILRARTHLKNPPSMYNGCFTTVEELHKPYSINIIPSLGSPSGTTDNLDGTLTVCRKPWWEYKFQKGFNYGFKQSLNGSLNTRNQNQYAIVFPRFQRLYVYIYDYVTRQPLLSNYWMPIASLSNEPDICEIETVIDGSMVTTLMIGSNVYTETTLTPAQLTDPNFYTTLTPGYYHIITKHTAEETTFNKTVYIP